MCISWQFSLINHRRPSLDLTLPPQAPAVSHRHSSARQAPKEPSPSTGRSSTFNPFTTSPTPPTRGQNPPAIPLPGLAVIPQTQSQPGMTIPNPAPTPAPTAQSQSHPTIILPASDPLLASFGRKVLPSLVVFFSYTARHQKGVIPLHSMKLFLSVLQEVLVSPLQSKITCYELIFFVGSTSNRSQPGVPNTRQARTAEVPLCGDLSPKSTTSRKSGIQNPTAGSPPNPSTRPHM